MPAEQPLSLRRALRTALVLVLALGLATPALVLADRREASAATAGEVLAEAARHAGKAYRYGATGPANFDCSGYTSYVFRQVGVHLPRTSGAQRAALPHVPKDQARPGDLIFTHDSGGRVYHVGIYAGGGTIWHSPRTGDVVKHSRIFSQNYTVGRTPLSTPPPPPPPPSTPIDLHYHHNPHLQRALGGVTSAEFPVNGGRVRLYRKGQIVWSPATGAKSVHGAIFARYGAMRWEQGPLGFPVSDELVVGAARESLFQRGKITWTAGTGAHVVWGDIRGLYDSRGGPTGPLGYPMTGEIRLPGGVKQVFTGATVFWDRDTRATVPLEGAVLQAYESAGGPQGHLGMPLEVEQAGARVEFEGGAIEYDAARRVATVQS